ncbi:MAG: transposase [Caldilineaceae bacterium]|nr:transposase [Caldilineaceae bacterium]
MTKRRKYREADYEATEKSQITLGEALPEEHLARFIVSVVALLDLSEIYAGYSERGGMPYAPEVLLGLLLYGYATGTFSSRKIERGTYESIPLRYIAGNMHPDHDTINQFRKENLETLKGLFVQVLMLAYVIGYVKLGNISIDGSKLHADASKSKAVSYGRIPQMEKRLQQEIDELFAMAEKADNELPDDFDIDNEIGRRRQKLASLAQAKAILDERARQRHAEEQAEYERKVAERQAKEEQSGKKSRGRPPQPPEPGARDKDQYNFTDPESRIMKNGNNKGFEQAYNAQAAVEHESRLIVGNTLSDHPNDKREGPVTAQAIPAALGRPAAAAMDNGYFGPETIAAFEAMGIEPYIATGRDSHALNLPTLLAGEPEPPPENADHKTKMLYKLRTQVGKAIYKLRKSTVEPVFGIIKEVMGFRQFSLRGLIAAAGEWNLVCLAYNLKRLHLIHIA